MDETCSLTFDNKGNVIMAGTFASPILTFGSVTLYNLISGFTLFFTKFDGNGNECQREKTLVLDMAK